MIGAGVQDGDVVVVRKQSTAEDGDVVAATVDAETTLKRLRLRNGQVVLAAENPAYTDIPAAGAELTIHGVVVGLLRRFPGGSTHDTAARDWVDPAGRTLNRRTNATVPDRAAGQRTTRRVKP
jgi:hypothetical protein